MKSQPRPSVSAQAPLWRVIALSETLAAGSPLRASHGAQDLVLFRDDQGMARALHDSCAHRRAPLSQGRVTPEGTIECPYHGWRYQGATGQCIAVPNLSDGERIPKAYRVPKFAVDERDGFIRIWTRADEAPTCSPALARARPLARPVRGDRLIAGRYDDCVDLLLDAPDAVLAIPRVAIVNVHRFGDPRVENGRIVVTYAAVAEWQRGAVAVSEYPMHLTIEFDEASAEAVITLTDRTGEPIAEAALGFNPVGRALCAIHWRGSTADMRTSRPRTIGVRKHFNPEVIRNTVDYVSRLRAR